MHPRTEVIQSGKVRNLDVTESLTYQGTPFVPSAATDEKSKVSSNDTTAGYLNGKLVAGANVTLTENNNGGNETLTIAANFTDADDKVKVSAGDTTPAFLDTKILAGTNITLTKGNAGGNETLTVSAAGGGVTSVNTLTGAVTLTAASVGAAPTSHTHAASDVTSGVFATARLASSGTASASTYLRGDQTWATIPGGGGGTTGFTPTQNVAAPNATINASRLLVDVATSSGDAVLQPKGFGAVMAQLPDSTDVGGNKRGSYAVDWQMHRATAAQVATGNYSVVLGGSSNTASQDYSVVGGRQNTVTAYSAIAAGYLNQTQNTYCFIGAGQSNTASGDKSIVVGGQSNTATATHSFIGGGDANTASGSYSSVLGGASNVATGTHSAVLGGNLNSAQSNYSVVSGNGAVSNGLGCSMFASGSFAAPGDCQTGEWVQRTFTSDAANQTAYLTSNGLQGLTGSGANLNYVTVRTGATMAFEWLVIGKRTDVVGANAAWTVSAAATNNSGTIALLGTPTITLIGDNTGGAVSIACQTHGQARAVIIRVNGVAGQTWNWAGFLRTIELLS